MDGKSDGRGQTRRSFCGQVTALTAAATSAVIVPSQVFADENKAAPNSPTTPDAAIARLLEGNRRFASGEVRHPHLSQGWRQSLEQGQHPYAVVLGCADSRVCPELLFDQGLGDLFVVRVAGNIVDVDVTASIEYAVNHLDTMLVMVLGHSNCGAVTATMDHLTDSATEPDEIVSLLYRIEPALVGLPTNLPRKARIAMGVERNVKFAVRRLSRVPHLRKVIKSRKLRIVGAVYDMHTGKVEMLS